MSLAKEYCDDGREPIMSEEPRDGHCDQHTKCGRDNGVRLRKQEEPAHRGPCKGEFLRVIEATTGLKQRIGPVSCVFSKGHFNSSVEDKSGNKGGCGKNE